MRFRPTLALLALALAVCPAGCSQKATAPTPAASTTAAAAAAAPTTAASAAAGDEDEEGTKKRRLAEPTTYLDGQPIAGIRFLEMPQKLQVTWKQFRNGRFVRLYSLADYIESLGVDLTTIKQVHLIGGRNRHVIIDGDELTRTRDKLFFMFTPGGKPRMQFPGGGMKVNTQIDMLQTLLIYQQRTPPKYSQRDLYTYFEEGVRIQGIPYESAERPGGTRVYVDGALVGAIKRKLLPNAAARPGTTEQGLTRFGLRAYLEHIGVSLAALQGMELVGDEEVAATFDAKAIEEKVPGLDFTLPKRNRGRIEVHLPDAPKKLDAVLLYMKTGIPDRVAQLTTPGSLATQGKTKNRIISAKDNMEQLLHDDARD